MKFEIVNPATKEKLFTNGLRKFSTSNPGNWIVAQFSDVKKAYIALKYAPANYRVMGVSQ